MVVFARLAVIAQNLHFSRQFGVVGHDRARLAQRAEVFAGIKAETARHPHGAGLPAFVSRPVRLAGILNHRDAAPGRDFENRIHVRALAKEMHRDDGLGAGRDGFFQQAGIQVVSRLINVHKNRPRPAKADRLDRGHEGAGNGDDFIVWPHAQRQQRKPEGIGSVAHADGMSRPAIGGKFLFKFGDKRAAGKSARVNHLAQWPHPVVRGSVRDEL